MDFLVLVVLLFHSRAFARRRKFFRFHFHFFIASGILVAVPKGPRRLVVDLFSGANLLQPWFDRGCVPPQVMPLGQRADELQHAAGMMSSPLASQAAITSSFSSSAMDETDDYMDYMGGGSSPLGLSSESSNPDRSCTSTPVGNDGSPAGESHVQKYDDDETLKARQRLRF